MRNVSKTSVAGVAAGAFLAADEIPGLSPVLYLGLKLLAALFITILGVKASDCPANCPGTDEQRRPRPWQAVMFCPLAIIVVVILAMAAVSGCITKNPEAGPANPTAPAYVVHPALATSSNAAVALAETAGTVTGTGPLPAVAVNGLFAAIGALSLLWARHKSQVAQGMAAGVVQAGRPAVAAVLAANAESPKFSAIAEALNQNMAAGQSPGADPSDPPRKETP